MKSPLLLLSTLWLAAPGFTPAVAAPNTLTADERRLGFELLFDGRSLDHWAQGGNWVIEDGTLFCRDKGGDAYYTPKFVPARRRKTGPTPSSAGCGRSCCWHRRAPGTRPARGGRARRC